MASKKHPNLIKFGQTIRRERLEKDISQEDLAARAGLHRNYVGALERGEYNMRLLVILKLTEALEVQPSALLRIFDEGYS